MRVIELESYGIRWIWFMYFIKCLEFLFGLVLWLLEAREIKPTIICIGIVTDEILEFLTLVHVLHVNPEIVVSFK